MSTARIAIVTALQAELQAVAAAFPESERSGVILAQCGVGAEAAARTVRALLQGADPPRLICSSGFCGGLAPGIEVGAAILADQVVCACGAGILPAFGGRLEACTTRIAIETTLLDTLAKRLAEQRVPHHRGTLVTVSSVVAGAEEKRNLAAKYHALAADMESFALAEAIEGRAAFVVLRAVSDAAADELPPEAASFLDEKGAVRLGQVLRFALRRPRNLKTLWRLKANAGKAAAGLTAAWKAVWPLPDS